MPLLLGCFVKLFYISSWGGGFRTVVKMEDFVKNFMGVFYVYSFFMKKIECFWYGGICFYIGMVIFLVVSLVSYNVTDSSWLYVSSDPDAITNKGGFLGAHFAAILFYLFGGASFLLLIPFLLVGFIIFTQNDQ